MNWNERPNNVSQLIDAAFDNVSTLYGAIFNNDGSKSFQICGVNLEKLAEFKLAEHQKMHPEEQFHMLDIGSCEGERGRSTLRHLLSKFGDDIKQTVYFWNLTEEKKPYPNIKAKEYIGTHYVLRNITSFKIENLTEKLKEVPEIHGKFDLIFSHMTFIHLVDPLGTFVQAITAQNKADLC